MYFDLTDEQQAIKATARDFLAARYKPARIRELADSENGFEQSDWEEMAELGWTGLALPEEWGGQGLGIVELAVLFEEMGYALAPSPLFSNTIAGIALALCGGDDRRLHDGAAGRGRRHRARRREGPGHGRRGRRFLPRRHRRRPSPPG